MYYPTWFHPEIFSPFKSSMKLDFASYSQLIGRNLPPARIKFHGIIFVAKNCQFSWHYEEIFPVEYFPLRTSCNEIVFIESLIDSIVLQGTRKS